MKTEQNLDAPSSPAREDLDMLVEQIKQIDYYQHPRSFVASYFEGVDGTVIPGITYQCDYRSEEEWGIGELRNRLTGADPRRFRMVEEAEDHVHYDEETNTLTLAIRPIRQAQEYRPHSADSLRATQGTKTPYSVRTVSDMREYAEKIGLPKPWPRKKAELDEAIVNFDEKKWPELYPGRFSDGETMTLSAGESGATSETLRRVGKAARDGYLGVGNASSPFSTGVFFYDTRDESQAIIEHRENEFDIYDERMAALKPVADELKERGYGWYMLGKPTVLDKGEGRKLYYWLNSRLIDGKQYSGWFTLEELRDEKFLEDKS